MGTVISVLRYSITYYSLLNLVSIKTLISFKNKAGNYLLVIISILQLIFAISSFFTFSSKNVLLSIDTTGLVLCNFCYLLCFTPFQIFKRNESDLTTTVNHTLLEEDKYGYRC